MPTWSPWRGCRRLSEGCRFCYVHRGDARRGVDTGNIVKTADFYGPVEKGKTGEYKMKPGLVFLCFQSDFLIAEADGWRGECWEMIRERSDCHFIFLTKRIDRFEKYRPPDWAGGYDNVTIGVSCENQASIEQRLPILCRLPIKHRNIILQPLIEEVNIEPYLVGVELVVVGGEYGADARPLRYEWVLKIRRQCLRANVTFEFRQCATHFVKEGREHLLSYNQLGKQARAAGIDFKASPDQSGQE